MDWCRLWHDLPNDPKWRTIAKVSKQPVALVISVYIHLLVGASKNENDRGRIQPNAEDLASALDLATTDVESILSAMQGRVLDGISLTGWKKRQPKREDESSDRVRNWRETKALPKTDGPENALKRNVTHGNALQRAVTQDPATSDTVTQRNAPEKIRLEKRNTHTVQVLSQVERASAPGEVGARPKILPVGQFDRWWVIWSETRGTHNRQQAVQAWISVVNSGNESSCFDCTASYIASLDDPSRGFNPQNFLFEQAKENFAGRWPVAGKRAKSQPLPEKKPYGCPVCKVVPCNCYEKFIAKEATNGAS